MVTVAAECRRADGVTLVECRLTNDHETAMRARLRSRLNGPTWPPRDGSHAAHGWDDGEWTSRLPPEGTVGVGFASPAPPLEDPVHVESLDEAGDQNGRFGQEPTPDDVARELTDPRPPRAGLFEPTADTETTGCETADDSGQAFGEETGAVTPTGYPTGDIPHDPEALLDAVDVRVDRLEALDAVRTVPEATVAVADADGLAGVRDLCARTERDRDRLLRLAARAETLAGRIEAANVPIETLERLA
ncbi:hypothetical protein [Halorarius litoreus]|uniref:DUF7857 domain-containing protein n=1 Tax=Halorarius litoreus TaxID=2962676 RepID=UPI0020CEFDF2|nr:hypothetical protein [Halorarius litoreus]